MLRNPTTDNVVEISRLEDLRDQIDELDDEIVRSLAERMAVARTIGQYKHRNNITILQPERWEEIIRSRTANGESQQLTRAFISKLYGIIHEESIHQQTEQMNKGVQAVDRGLFRPGAAYGGPWDQAPPP